ncbi:hypothetical protein LTS18_010610 [Coniosporium uncinatum]|uniref:Uncharacterized protein n=1 Tax=Coniosporium uncinatum TaxID=93489 RepID=A0ACC3DKX3_9PEZI|nr:hypothetical protein LTS18_010610 [Coniosporium uncinatum]
MPYSTCLPEEEQYLFDLIAIRKQELLIDPGSTEMLMKRYDWLVILEGFQKRIQAALHAFEHPPDFDGIVTDFGEPRYPMETGVMPGMVNFQSDTSTPIGNEARGRLQNQASLNTRLFSSPQHQVGDPSAEHTTISSLGEHAIPSSSLNPVPSMVQQYELARAITNSNGSAPRRVTVPSQRRSWSDSELQALMNGLDAVKGPHWSQILGLYGQGGSISEVLKNRNQVQLKDKARNLKLFFLKSGVEVPEYLKGVTGDLRSRAPGVARRKEREKAKGQGQGQTSVLDAE